MSAGAETDFDEEWYLKTYPDVAEAVRVGRAPSGYQHYVLHGRSEGRSPRPSFDPAWYARVYPSVAREVDPGDAAAVERHYRERGRYRGYLPYPAAARPRNAAAMTSAFGGLWIDAPNAPDLIAGRRELGWITADEATLLTQFVDRGYVVLRNAVATELVDRVEAVAEAAYHGELPQLRFECAPFPGQLAWRPEVLKNAARAIDVHWFSNHVRDASFSPAILRFLHLLFERPVLASQTLVFYNGSRQATHQDSAYVPYSLPLQFAASWIALEDVEPGAGELEYFVESHRQLPDFLYDDAHKSVHEARRLGAGDNRISEDLGRHLDAIQRDANARNLAKERFLARRGDALIWHAELAHGGSATSASRTRKSLVTHYCPSEVAPLYAENNPVVVKQHSSGSFYCSGNYSE